MKYEKKMYLIKMTMCAIVFTGIGWIAGVMQSDIHYRPILEAYDQYNKSAEDLLDALDNKYDWVDAFDPKDYYESVEHLDSLLWR